MTIASEITRLQWAKWDIRISIWNKWVSVPSSAKLDDYSAYIDQIQQGSWDDILSYFSGILSVDWDMIYISRSDGVNNRYWDYSWTDWNNLLMAKPYEYEDYSSTGHSQIYTNVDLIALPKWATAPITWWFTMYTWWWYTTTQIKYYYINWNKIRFYWSTGEYTDYYWCKEVTFDGTAWSIQDIWWDGTTPANIWWNEDILYSSVVGSTSWWWNFFYKRKPH